MEEEHQNEQNNFNIFQTSAVTFCCKIPISKSLALKKQTKYLKKKTKNKNKPEKEKKKEKKYQILGGNNYDWHEWNSLPFLHIVQEIIK